MSLYLTSKYFLFPITIHISRSDINIFMVSHEAKKKKKNILVYKRFSSFSFSACLESVQSNKKKRTEENVITVKQIFLAYNQKLWQNSLMMFTLESALSIFSFYFFLFVAFISFHTSVIKLNSNEVCL